MKAIAVFFAAVTLLAAAPAKQTFAGIITDEMCGLDHKAMNVQPDSKCVTECVKMGSTYVLASGGNIYKLSDQKTPGKFAAQKVTVTGTLNGKTIQVNSIAPAR
ncbi:MAG TPA: DUF5818 domain-containing protein [Bryobacteraceae bacterium]|nr:DUF5818 domain-containing protein [Bryobacteraceae bacterium]